MNNLMKPDALHNLARQLRTEPDPDTLENAAAVLEALAIQDTGNLAIALRGLLELEDYAYEPSRMSRQIERGSLCPVLEDRFATARAALAAYDGDSNAISMPSRLP